MRKACEGESYTHEEAIFSTLPSPLSSSEPYSMDKPLYCPSFHTWFNESVEMLETGHEDVAINIPHTAVTTTDSPSSFQHPTTDGVAFLDLNGPEFCMVLECPDGIATR